MGASFPPGKNELLYGAGFLAVIFLWSGFDDIYFLYGKKSEGRMRLFISDVGIYISLAG
jgi:hypothetical protein